MERFLIIELETVLVQDGNGDNQHARASMRVASEAQVSNRIDMADCFDGDFRIMYLTDAGELVPVTYGKRETAWGSNIAFAYAHLIAEGVSVGNILYTDH